MTLICVESIRPIEPDLLGYRYGWRVIPPRTQVCVPPEVAQRLIREKFARLAPINECPVD